MILFKVSILKSEYQRQHSSLAKLVGVFDLTLTSVLGWRPGSVTDKHPALRLSCTECKPRCSSWTPHVQVLVQLYLFTENYLEYFEKQDRHKC